MLRRIRPVWTLGSLLVVALVAAVVPTGCSRNAEPADTATSVVVSIQPLAGLVQPMLPEGVELAVLIPPGQSPHQLSLTPSDLATLGEAELVVTVGLGLEGGLERVLRGLDTEWVRMSEAGGVPDDGSHSHDHDADDEGAHAHEHAGADPHLWLETTLAKRLVDAVSLQLAAIEPTHAEEIQEKADRLKRDLDTLDAEMRQGLAPARGVAIATHHDSLTRLADRYGLVIVAHALPISSVDPTPDELAKAAGQMREAGVEVIFSEPQLNSAAVDRLAELTGARTATLDLIGTGDYFDMMRQLAADIAVAAGPAGEASQPTGEPESDGP